MSDKLNLIDTIANQDKFSTFARLMTSSGTNGVFNSEGVFTVFVPTNDAFAKMPEAKINELLNETNQTALKALLSYHILSGKVMAANLASTPERESSSGEGLAFSDSNGLKVNGASVLARNIEATNGVVHAVDTVLTPGKAMNTAAASASTTSSLSTGGLTPIVDAQTLATPASSPSPTDSVGTGTPQKASTTPPRANIKSIL